jgi:hypothetical protein
LIGQNLRITVSDTGPGMNAQNAENRSSGISYDGREQVSTGVGLANIRDRLVQAYGTNHRFDMYEPPEGVLPSPSKYRLKSANRRLHLHRSRHVQPWPCEWNAVITIQGPRNAAISRIQLHDHPHHSRR